MRNVLMIRTEPGRVDSSGEGRLLRELQDGLVFGPAAVWSLRVGADRRTGAILLRAFRSRVPARSLIRRGCRTRSMSGG